MDVKNYLLIYGGVGACWRIRTCTRERMRAHAPKNIVPERKKQERKVYKERNK